MKVLVVSPHPDDEAIGCGGTLRKHVVQGDSVKVVFLTSGERGGHGVDEEATRITREYEAYQAQEILGISDTEYWRQPDGVLRVSRKLTARMVECLRNYKPDLIYVTNEREFHSDHRAAARLVCAAQRNILNNTTKVLVYEVWTPLTRIDEIIDISAYIDTKLQAIRAYRSQCSVLRFDEAILGLARYRGEMYCWPKEVDGMSGKYAEVFRLGKF